MKILTMRTALYMGVVALAALAGFKTRIPKNPIADNPLLQEWTGPYGGVPRWIK